MRAIYLYLEGYIGIFNGLGLDRIEIDLSKAKHKICLIAGPNGTGKSTIIKALHVLPDTNDCFIPNRNARKIIVFANDEITYRIDITSICDKNGKRTNEAHVSKNGIELNPNGNVNSYKESVFAEFDIDANFIAMSRISSEDRGLADKTPAERKKIIASRIESLDVYNEMYKSLNKKANIFKSHLNSISSKLQNLGNREELELRLAEIQKSEYALTMNIEDNKKALIEAETRIKVLDPAGNLGIEYNEVQQKKNDISIQLEKLEKEIDDTVQKMGSEFVYETSTGRTERIKDGLTEIEKEIASYKGERSQIISTISDIDTKVKDLMFNLKKAEEGDIDSSTYSTAIKAKESKESDLIALDTAFKTTGNRFCDTLDFSIDLKAINRVIKVTQDMSLLDFTDVDSESDKNVVDLIASYIDVCPAGAMMIAEFEKAYTCGSRDLEELGTTVIKLKEETSYIVQSIDDLSALIQALEIPKKCQSLSDDKCSLISNFRNIQSQIRDLEKKLSEKMGLLDDTERTFRHTDYRQQIYQVAIRRVRTLDSTLKYLELYEDVFDTLFEDIKIRQLKDTLWVSDASTIQKIINRIANSKDDLVELYNYMAEREVIITGITTIESTIAKHKDLVDNINRINHDINSLKEDKDRYLQKLDSIKLSIETSEVLQKKQLSLLEKSQDLDLLQSEFDNKTLIGVELDERLSSIDKAGEKIFALQQDIQKYQTIVDTGMDRLREVSNEKKRIESQILIWDNFQKEYAEYNEKYNYVNVLRKYSSPTQGGIQSLYMSMYMNKTLDLSNQILGMLFNGQYRILDYIINESEFRIPFIGAGMMVDDISSGSTSQKCIMGSIISMVSNSSASPLFNIALLDEVDGGLDQDNRMMFADTILKAADILGFAQLFSISHSIEASINNVDVILLSNKQNYIDQFANSNIIYKYEGGV